MAELIQMQIWRIPDLGKLLIWKLPFIKQSTRASQCLHPKRTFVFFRWAQLAKDRFSTEFKVRSHNAENIFINMAIKETDAPGIGTRC